MTNWSWSDDPNLDNEAQKYDNPVPSRDYILKLLNDRGKPLTHRQICAELDLTDDEAVEAVRRRLRAMERDGQLLSNRRGAYGVAEKMDLIRGVIIGHRDGFGFLKPDDGSDDLYLSARQMRCGFDGDKVLARSGGVDQRGRREATIVEVLERKTQRIVGRYFKESNIGFVTPENRRISQDILIPESDALKAKNGQFVLVEITQQPSYRGQAEGSIVEIIGDHMAPGMEIDVAIRNHDIPHVWPAEVEAAAEHFGSGLTEGDYEHRFDLRKTPFVTIDGEDAKDFDDAVFCEKKRSGGWKLYVAIADVSHYVHPGDPLDQEARKRGNSVYFPEHVVPMLPVNLSNGLCSLNPQVDRLALVCEMSVSDSGKVSRYGFFEAVICSHARLTYNKVGAMLQEPESMEGQDLREQYSAVVPHLEDLYGLYHAFRGQRQQRGAIDFETTETKIEFGEDRKIERIVPTQRNDAHRIIEECMLAANVCAAKFLQKYNLPALYRVHEGPKNEKLENLRAFLKELSIPFMVRTEPKPSDYQEVLGSIKDRPDFELIQTVMLRSMNQAVYSPENKGHFGLSYGAYAHFTSPIRRYPDLLVHRAIRYFVRSGKESTNAKRTADAPPIPQQKILPYDAAAMVELGEQCSMTERRADEATWDVIGWLKCEYMSDKIGDVFKGIITGVTGFGLFVELKDIYVEGLVHVSSLNSDYYHFDEVRHRLVGERSGLMFGLGEEVTVSVAKVNLDDRKIDFEMLAGGKRVRWSKEDSARQNKDKAQRKSKKASAGKSQDAGSVNAAGKGRGAAKKAAAGKAKAGTSRHEVAKAAAKKQAGKKPRPKKARKKR
ncbi:ribonuclease R [Ketobacter alkanivorans]|uniref:Ribonuclease R n=1 Tax=Ketobacter alkanivorans TaxID=1917421 RepID=A0A2K9LMU2_9GAMM|nr:ribonuclease R [Ketobacter alkanivorans]AUM13658.1 ribonuclease R [Ketobacter alkanivorans]